MDHHAIWAAYRRWPSCARRAVASAAIQFFLNSSRPLNRGAEEHRDFREHHRLTDRMHQLPGILGAVLLISGLAVFFLARTEDEPPEEKAVK